MLLDVSVCAVAVLGSADHDDYLDDDEDEDDHLHHHPFVVCRQWCPMPI